jgi:hypothetical protein
MKLQVTYKNSPGTATRVDYIVTVYGTDHTLVVEALGNQYNDLEAIKAAQRLFGPGVELAF